MITIPVNHSKTYYIWAPLALTGADLLPEKNVLIEIKDTRIISIRRVPRNQLPLFVKKDPGFICFEDTVTLMPCLIDAHVHLALDGKKFEAPARLSPQEEYPRHRIMPTLKAISESGIGAVRDGSDLKGINLSIKRKLTKSNYLGPQIVATGQALRRKGSYGKFLGKAYTTAAEIPGLIQSLKEAGADQVKVIASGIASFLEYGLVSGPVISGEDLRAITGFASKLKLKVMAHASSAEAVARVVESGVDSVEHGYFVGNDTLQKMALKQVAWVPTIIPVAVQARKPLCEVRTTGEIAVIKRLYEDQLEKLNIAVKAGVPLGIGTDAGANGVKHASNLVEEMLLYSKATLDNSYILRAATTGNAIILGLEKDIGRIDKDYKAALIAVNGNPLEDLSRLNDIIAHFLIGNGAGSKEFKAGTGAVKSAG